MRGPFTSLFLHLTKHHAVHILSIGSLRVCAVRRLPNYLLITSRCLPSHKQDFKAHGAKKKKKCTVHAWRKFATPRDPAQSNLKVPVSLVQLSPSPAPPYFKLVFLQSPPLLSFSVDEKPVIEQQGPFFSQQLGLFFPSFI